MLKTEDFGFTLGRESGPSGSDARVRNVAGISGVADGRTWWAIGDATTAWLKEAQSASGKGFESVVLFALDQFCLIGYEVPLPADLRRSLRMG